METKLPEQATVKGDGHTINIGARSSFDPKAQWAIEGSGHTFEIGEGVVMRHTRIIIRGRNCRVVIGNNVRLKQGTISVAGEGSSLVIGEGTSWESGQIIAEGGQSITIGKDCMFSHEVMIRTADGHGIFDATTREFLNPAKPVVVEDHVWIGNGARVNKGATLGTGMVLAGASVLSGKAKPRTIYAGVPARPQRSNINWSRTYEFGGVPAEYRIQDEVAVQPAQPQGVVSRLVALARR